MDIRFKPKFRVVGFRLEPKLGDLGVPKPNKGASEVFYPASLSGAVVYAQAHILPGRVKPCASLAQAEPRRPRGNASPNLDPTWRDAIRQGAPLSMQPVTSPNAGPNRVDIDSSLVPH